MSTVKSPCIDLLSKASLFAAVFRKNDTDVRPYKAQRQKSRRRITYRLPADVRETQSACRRAKPADLQQVRAIRSRTE